MTIDKIVSKENARLKAVRAARDGRDNTTIFIEGLRLAEEALRSDIALFEGFIDAKFGQSKRQRTLIERLMALNIPIYHCGDAAFRSLADTSSSQGIILTARRPDLAFDPQSISRPLFIFLYEISDPSNLGAVLRSAEAAGVDGIFLSVGAADPYSPKALRASMGSAFRVRVTRNVDLGSLVLKLRSVGIVTLGAVLGANQPYFQTDWTPPTLLVIGSESNGLPENVVALLDRKTFIPMQNGVESLNLAVSAGILLFEASRARGSAEANEQH